MSGVDYPIHVTPSIPPAPYLIVCFGRVAGGGRTLRLPQNRT
jgi:hypothetical protein